MDLRDFAPADEKPLDRLVHDGGFCSIFRSIACVGDSLSSGEFESILPDGKKLYHDFYWYSWGQYIARACGSTVRNFSRGGMTASNYCNAFAESRGFWDPALACQAYIVALGCNDVVNQKQEMGSTGDVCMEDWRKNRPTFAGYYAQIIQRYKEIEPRAKFFLVTLPRDHREERAPIAQAHRKLMYDLAELFENCYVIDLWQYAPVYGPEFRSLFFMGGHMNPCGYVLTSQFMISYIDYIVRHNMQDFKEVGYIGSPLAFEMDAPANPLYIPK